MSTLNDLQMHFPLNHIHLPKETISVVTDTVQMFESVTRLSKSKGKIEVVVKIGSQFVQVTTAHKQDVLSGLQFSCIINDIFRLEDIEEASAQTDDISSFNLRADGGKIVMCFNSAERAELLQTLRSAKLKYAKDSRMPKLVERLVRPQDVPGTILNLALTNLSSPYHALRVASYNLLGALCKSFNFGAAARFTCNNSMSVRRSSLVGFARNAWLLI